MIHYMLAEHFSTSPVNTQAGEGFFHTKVTGPGHIWIQTMPFSKLAGLLSVGKR